VSPRQTTPLPRPATDDGLLARGFAYHKEGRLQEAIAAYDQVLTANPNHLEALHLSGYAYFQLGDHGQALQRADRALQINSDIAALHSLRGTACLAEKQFDKAAASFDRATALDPNDAAAFCNRGIALRELKQSDAAVASYDRAIGCDPAFAEAFNNRGFVLLDLERFTDALNDFDRAISFKPDYPVAFNNRGIALIELDRLDEALAGCDRALALKRIDDAIASYDRALSLLPQYAEARQDRGFCRLLIGNYRDGFADYEWRWQVAGSVDSRGGFPDWRGEDLAGRELLVLDEQGFGDVIALSRYLGLLAQRHCRITLLTRPSLVRLMRSLPGEIEVVAALVPGRRFDFQCALMSLPHRIGSELATIPNAVPYLAAEPQEVARWRGRIGAHGFKIGINWQGNPTARADRGRSIPLVHYFALADIPGVRLISLQTQHGLDQLAQVPTGVTIETLGPDFNSGSDAFIDSAAVMTSLDLIVTSDTAAAHLAGALGRPTFVALKHVPEWRWLLDRSDSPWYPTMRLFRQPAPGDWIPVFDEIKRELLRICRAQ
jgi:tetratricopeptide (TPR) repeat protein